MKTNHKIDIKIAIKQSWWKVLPDPINIQFDSTAPGTSDSINELDWWQGFAGGNVRGFMAPILNGGQHTGLSVWWAEFKYNNGKTAVVGAVINGSIERCAGRVHGNITVSVDGNKVMEFEGATALDGNGMAFHAGTVAPLVRWDCVQWLIARAASVTDPPLQYFKPPACPDVPSGQQWQEPWSAKDRTGDTRYMGDGASNPDVLKDIGTIPVPRWYDRQTHRPGDYRKATVSDFFSVWWAAVQAQIHGDASPEIATLMQRWADATVWWTESQVGCPSPTTPGKWVDGRPLNNWFLARTAELFISGRKYNASTLDKTLPRPPEMHEGRPLLRPPGKRFTEHVNRENLDLAQANSGRYAGQYIGPNGADPEHYVTSQLFAIACLTGNPFAIMQLRYLSEEAYGYGQDSYQHSDRTWGNLVKDGLLHGYLFFRDARYLEKARGQLAWLETHRIDYTPYRGYLTRGFVGIKPRGSTAPFYAATALGQLSTIIVACVEWARTDPDPEWRKRWLAMAKYGVDCIKQPGVYDASRGGFIDTYSGDGPEPPSSITDRRSVAERLEATSGSRDRSYINWQGWIIPAVMMYAREAGDETLMDEAKGWAYILAQKSVSRIPILSRNSDSAWNMLYPVIANMGRPTFLAAPPDEEPQAGDSISDGSITVWGTGQTSTDPEPLEEGALVTD